MSNTFGFSSIPVPVAPSALGKTQRDGLRSAKEIDEKLRSGLMKYFDEVDAFTEQVKNLSKFSGFVVPTGKLEDPAEIQKIQSVVWLRMDVIMTPRGVRVRYTSKGKKSFCEPTPTDRASLEDKIIHGKGLKRSKRKSTRRFERPKDGQGTLLSVNGQQRELVIITLSKNANIWFNRSGGAISTSWEHQCSFLEAGVVMHDGTIHQFSAVDEIPAGGQKNEKCRTAYFIVDPTIPSRKHTPGTPVNNTCPAPTGTYDGIPKAFNIHVDVVGKKKKKTGQAKAKRSFIPIIIDPDVRHPGGFGGNQL